jgi:hypothetical protein
MKKPAIAALAALLLAGPVLADEPAQAAAAPSTKAEGGAKPAQPKPAEVKKSPGSGAPKTGQKPGETTKKEAPCEPVKPCPID